MGLEDVHEASMFAFSVIARSEASIQSLNRNMISHQALHPALRVTHGVTTGWQDQDAGSCQVCRKLYKCAFMDLTFKTRDLT